MINKLQPVTSNLKPVTYNGFTLIELLVVIFIIGFLGLAIMLQQNISKEDYSLKSSASNISSIIREAQSNATAAVKCEGQGSAVWIVNFRKVTSPSNLYYLDIYCSVPGGSPIVPETKQKTTELNKSDKNIEIISIAAVGCNPSFTQGYIKIFFRNLSSEAGFDAAGTNCSSASKYTINLKNIKTNQTLTVVAEKGGQIDIR